MAIFIDHILGNHVVLTLGKNLENHLAPIEKIVKKRFVSSTSQLAQRLKDENHQEALKELKEIAEYHADIFRRMGIILELDNAWSN